VIDTIGQTLVRSVIELLNKYGLRKKIIAYVKNEGSNLNAMIIALLVVVNCGSIGLERVVKAFALGTPFQKHINMAL